MPVDAPPQADKSPMPGDEPTAPAGALRTAGRWVFLAIAFTAVAGSFAVWGYTYYLHLNRPEPPDFLADLDLAQAADQICEATVFQAAQIPGASVAATAQERAEQIDASTALFGAMVDDLAALEATGAKDQLIWSGFVGDWQTLVDDRQRYARSLETDPEAQFLLTVVTEERLDRRISRVAEANKMLSCVAPDDV